jgi:16S rRNA (cytidine1402-2'-O)-methyltransferase
MPLYLLPNVLDKSLSHRPFFPPVVEEVVSFLDGLIVENEKEGRHYLKRFSFPKPKTFRDIPLHLLNEHSSPEEIYALLFLLKKGGKWGLISDAGLPILADPGAELVLKAQELGISVTTFPGPSSIIYALMLSGLSAQCFAFQGYLPRNQEALEKKLVELITLSQKFDQTQLFIETPYRTEKLLHILISLLPPFFHLSVAWDLSLPTQGVITQKVKIWRTCSLPHLQKKPAVFLFKQ